MKKTPVLLTVSYAFVQFFFWFSFGTLITYASPYLLACGLSNTAIGFICAAACALSLLVQPVLAAYADRDSSASIKVLLLILAGILCALGFGLMAARGSGPWLNGLLMCGGILLIHVSLPFINSLATETINQGKPLSFSIARGFGSIGYAVMSYVLGRLFAVRGAETEPLAVIVISALFFLSIALFPFHKTSKKDAAEANPASKGDTAAFIRQYPTFFITLLGCVFVFTGHELINNFLYQIVVAKGGTSEHMGIASGLAGLLEIFPMFSFALLLQWKDSRFWFRISGIFFTLKTLGTLLVGSMGALYAVQLLQPLGWGIISVASVYYVNAITREQDHIKGQAYMTMSISAATIIASLAGGWLIDAAGVNGMLITAVICSALGAAIILRKQKKAQD